MQGSGGLRVLHLQHVPTQQHMSTRMIALLSNAVSATAAKMTLIAQPSIVWIHPSADFTVDETMFFTCSKRDIISSLKDAVHNVNRRGPGKTQRMRICLSKTEGDDVTSGKSTFT